MNGLPATSRSAFGIVRVTGSNRVAKPPARMATGSMSGEDNLRSFEVEPEADFFEPGLRHGVTQLVAIGCIEHQEPSASRAHEFAANGAALPAELVPIINLGVAHAARAAFLVLPVLVHQLPE